MIDETPVELHTGELEASFLPRLGMVCVSLRHRGEELLGRIDELERYVRHGSTLGIPVLHPWANRLSGLGYAAAGREVELPSASELLHYDARGQPIHGVPGARLAWEVVHADRDALTARLDWSKPALLAVFPYPHVLESAVRLGRGDLTVETTLTASADVPVPVSFGFHPYLSLPGAPRAEWTVELPSMSRLVCDERGIPTGEEAPYPGLHGPLDRDYDDGFAGLPSEPAFAVSGGGRRIDVAFLDGFRYAQIFAPPGRQFVCFEPMTAPTNALKSGHGLTVVDPGGSYRAAFRLGVTAASA
jgi:galactose mutarotase-like enzyme